MQGCNELGCNEWGCNELGSPSSASLPIRASFAPLLDWALRLNRGRPVSPNLSKGQDPSAWPVGAALALNFPQDDPCHASYIPTPPPCYAPFRLILNPDTPHFQFHSPALTRPFHFYFFPLLFWNPSWNLPRLPVTFSLVSFLKEVFGSHTMLGSFLAMLGDHIGRPKKLK